MNRHIESYELFHTTACKSITISRLIFKKISKHKEERKEKIIKSIQSIFSDYHKIGLKMITETSKYLTYETHFCVNGYVVILWRK